jgi:hypothetical protein
MRPGRNISPGPFFAQAAFLPKRLFCSDAHPPAARIPEARRGSFATIALYQKGTAPPIDGLMPLNIAGGHAK